MKKYKLTDQNLQTYNGCQWKIRVEKTTSGEGYLCSEGWLHYYHHPLLAALLNPIHANISKPKLFEAKALGIHINDNGLKGGCTRLTLIKEIEFPNISLNQRIAFGILCSLEVYKEKSYIFWANNWLNNINRTRTAADAAHAAADAAYAAYAAAHAAYAAYAAAHAAYAAHAATNVAHAATNVAHAAHAAAKAAGNIFKLNLIKIAKKAMIYK
jgi:hypothetical protein